MYKLREKRLKEFYTCDDVLGDTSYLMEAQTATDTHETANSGNLLISTSIVVVSVHWLCNLYSTVRAIEYLMVVVVVI